MGNNAVKTIVLLMVLVVLSVLIGAQVSDSLSNSIGAFAVIGGVIMGFGMLLLGKHSWLLILYLPILVLNAPLGRFVGMLAEFPTGFVLTGAVLVYGVLQWAMGYVKLRWRALWPLDILLAGFCLYMIWGAIEHPVSFYFLNKDADYVGGKDYVWAIAAVVYYIAISMMCGEADECLKVFKRCTPLFFISQTAYMVINLYYNRGMTGGTRLLWLTIFATSVLYYVYASVPLLRLVTSAKHLSLFLLALLASIRVGSRQVLVTGLLGLSFLSFLKREIAVAVVLGGVAYGLIVLLGTQHVWDNAPSTMQRVIAVMPGTGISEDVLRDNEDSNQVRKNIWSAALDARSGYILDYIWGDGYQVSGAYLSRMQIAHYRRSGKRGSQAQFEEELMTTGSWHNGWITTLKHLGIVGLVYVNLIFLCGAVLLIQVSGAYAHHELYPTVIMFCLPFVAFALAFPWGALLGIDFWGHIQFLGYIKLFYCIAREKHMLRPLFSTQAYVPLTIREMEQQKL